MQSHEVAPHVFVILGATGDLTRRKLLPALAHLRTQGLCPEETLIVGAALPDVDVEAFRASAREALSLVGNGWGKELQEWCDAHVFYRTINQGSVQDYQALARYITELEKAHRLPGNRVFYLALPPTSVPGAIEALGESGLCKCRGWARLVIEKPFGYDFHSARKLNTELHRYFNESQIFRIDHYLGKETVQNLLAFRFANPIFESLWNRDKVDNVQITVAEEIGVGHRGAYYQDVGALRDMIQNHLTQLLTVVAMEIPVTFEAEAIRAEKLKALHSIAPITPQDVVFGQYTAWRVQDHFIPSYQEEPGVRKDSMAETYAALKVEIHNWRWQGVPFYLRTGKRLPRKLTQVAVIFREAPTLVFRSLEPGSIPRNMLLITLQPSEGFSLCFSVKSPWKPFQLAPHALQFSYESAFGALPDAYETLLYDIMLGDQTLFVSAEFTESAWRLYDPLLKGEVPIYKYTAGTWGPQEADLLLARAGHQWQLGW